MTPEICPSRLSNTPSHSHWAWIGLKFRQGLVRDSRSSMTSDYEDGLHSHPLHPQTPTRPTPKAKQGCPRGRLGKVLDDYSGEAFVAAGSGRVEFFSDLAFVS